MAGNGQRFFDEGYDLLKPLIDVNGKPMFKRVIDNLHLGDKVKPWFIVRQDHVHEYNIDKRIREYFPQKFSQEQSAPVQQVAASSRGASGRKASRKVKLTPSQVAIARKLNVPLEEYAKHIEGV